MHLASLNIAQPRTVEWDGALLTTSIFKIPVDHGCRVTFLGIEGDTQSDRHHHGGPDKAVYAYDLDHYRHWKTVLDWQDWAPGLFGENLTTEGLIDRDVLIGDLYRIGSVLLRVVQPRFPCTRLNARFGMGDMIRRFNEQRRHGIYFRVEQEGVLTAGDGIALVERSPHGISVEDVAVCYLSEGRDRSMGEAIIGVPFLPEVLRRRFSSFLE